MAKIFHQIQEDQGFYNFSNIRYAQPPIGQLRFAAPKAIEGVSKKINDGSVGVICPQGVAGWNSGSNAFVKAYTNGDPFAEAAILGERAQQSAKIPPLDPRTTEDCLFLDVFVPKKVFDSMESGAKAPVYLWVSILTHIRPKKEKNKNKKTDKHHFPVYLTSINRYMEAAM